MIPAMRYVSEMQMDFEMRQQFLVTFHASAAQLKGNDAENLRDLILDSLGFPEWLEKPEVLTVVEVPCESET